METARHLTDGEIFTLICLTYVGGLLTGALCRPLATVEFKRPDDPFMRACDPAKGAACFT